MQLSPIEPKNLCLSLLNADTEIEVIDLLKEAGYWDDAEAWHPFGGIDGNFSIIGNQSDSADYALVEKLVNSVDAVLMGECLAKGTLPNSPDAPSTIQEAVAVYLGDGANSSVQGNLADWPQAKRRQISNRIALAATGTRSNPSFTIVDDGEGQTPERMPDTLLSLDKQNKVDIHFVQGKFNMGGTGALRFCGRHNLQLIISRRDPRLAHLHSSDPSFDQWGFTVVRRDNPTESKKTSTYTYLAPLNNQGVLRFASPTLSIFPEGHAPYARSSTWGTAIKLYEYDLTGKSHILRRDGLLQRLDLLLPRVALPVRLHECRDFAGGDGSFDTTLTGLNVRLNDDRGLNLESGFPISTSLAILGEHMTAEIFAFKRDRSKTYKKSEGIIFVVNGQTHGHLPQSFFNKKAVGMSQLYDSILVVMDCTRISGRAREDLFMNSRDRLEQGSFLKRIQEELQRLLKDNQSLRELRERRRKEDMEEKLANSRPLVEVLEEIVRKSPALTALFGGIGPLPDPIRSDIVSNKANFEGHKHPTFFRFRNTDYGRELHRTTASNMRSRIPFETDVANDYFSRQQLPGKHVLKSIDNPSIPTPELPDHTLNLDNGVATLNLSLPTNAQIGDVFGYSLTIEDETLPVPFENKFDITVGQYQEPSGGSGGRKNRNDTGEGGDEAPRGLALPNTIEVYENDWGKHHFDKYSALRAVVGPSDYDPNRDQYDYYINMDNLYLKSELRGRSHSEHLVRARWRYGMVLIAMAVLQKGSDEADESVSESPLEQVSSIMSAVAPVLLPLIEHLGALSTEEVT